MEHTPISAAVCVVGAEVVLVSARQHFASPAVVFLLAIFGKVVLWIDRLEKLSGILQTRGTQCTISEQAQRSWLYQTQTRRSTAR